MPARTRHAKPGPSVGRDPAYKLASTVKGTVPSIRCKACNESPPLKSNPCIVAEIERLADAGGLMTRRLFSALERSIGTSSSHNTVWHWYAPYNPQMVGKDLTIFRVVSNFVLTGDDGRTPAMRLGIERAPLTFKGLLWPGQRIPRP